MKRYKIFPLILAVLMIVPLLCFASCKPKPIPNAHFVAKVTEVHEKQLFVTVIDKGTSSLGNGTPAYVSIPANGYNAVSVGDFVIVEYDTMVQEIYPPIVPNVFSITKCDANGNPLQ
jgi:hypothetical protein